ncbi:response regulator transcription factor [Hymenobacter sp. AT01-02]|uniref:response regulator transcription factor n=1 Tax=Hymenobacter sp. AT01-02 TaxID=1571877 RepID=UPI0006E2CDD1|nr:response regulator transcription factor [Hymenobacter sp. AT01-02]
MPTILLVEDELSLARIVQDSLETRGFTVHHAPDGQQGWQLFQLGRPDLVVTDVMMPVRDGFELARQIRGVTTTVPILFLTARSQAADAVQGFELGGNDYVRKPFSLDELVARIQALLGRASTAAQTPTGPLTIGRYRFDYPEQRLQLADGSQRPVALTHREAELLKRLFDHRTQVLTRTIVLRELWGDDSFFNGRSLDVFITRLRRYLRHDPSVRILNVRGVGIN